MVGPIQTFRYPRFGVWVAFMALYRITVGRFALPVTPLLLAVVLFCELCMQFEAGGTQTSRIRPLSEATCAFPT